jgi:hypothetical protein
MLDVSNIDQKGNKTVVVDKKDVLPTFYSATDLNMISHRC